MPKTLAHMLDIAHIDPDQLDQLGVDQLRELVGQLLERSGRDAREIDWRDAKIDKLTFEVAQLKRLQYGTRSEKSGEQLSADQRALFDEAVDADVAAIEEQIAALKATLPPKTEARTGWGRPGARAAPRHHGITTIRIPGSAVTRASLPTALMMPLAK